MAQQFPPQPGQPYPQQPAQPAQPRQSPLAGFFGKHPAYVMWHGMALLILGFFVSQIPDFFGHEWAKTNRVLDNIAEMLFIGPGLFIVITSMLTVTLTEQNDRWARVFIGLFAVGLLMMVATLH